MSENDQSEPKEALLPSLEPVARDNLLQLHEKVDAFFEMSREAYPTAFQCGEGCSMCCHQTLDLSPAEMARIVEGLSLLDGAAHRRLKGRLEDVDGEDICPLLEEDKCTVYAHRPLICRSHGAPIQVREGERVWQDVCPLNFTGTPSLSDVDVDHVIDIERANQLLALINHLAFGEERGSERINLREALKVYLQRAGSA